MDWVYSHAARQTLDSTGCLVNWKNAMKSEDTDNHCHRPEPHQQSGPVVPQQSRLDLPLWSPYVQLNPTLLLSAIPLSHAARLKRRLRSTLRHLRTRQDLGKWPAKCRGTPVESFSHEFSRLSGHQAVSKIRIARVSVPGISTKQLQQWHSGNMWQLSSDCIGVLEGIVEDLIETCHDYNESAPLIPKSTDCILLCYLSPGLPKGGEDGWQCLA